tara:strand:- start:419 stop:1363 length:945 start_codon:yes stop_codon:yes gene_type:complete
MNIENWLYFRTVADEDNDDGDTGTEFNAPTSICVPVSAIQQIEPYSATQVNISFSNLILRDDLPMHAKGHKAAGKDHVVLNVTQGKTKEVMTALAELISGQGAKGDGFTVVADDMTTNAANETVAARYFHPDITGVAGIHAYKTEQGLGMHEYYEVVTPMTADDDDVAASLSILLPRHCIILEAGMTAATLATSNHGLVALEIHSAAIADDAASGGTEILGADTLNLTQVEDNDDYAGTGNTGDNTSIPSANLDISSDAIHLDTIHSGVMDPIDRNTDHTHFQVTAKEDMSSMTGTPAVGVYIKWFGQPAVALN